MAARDARNQLQVAVVHEVGNLIAAMRLSAYLLPAADARERARGARQIEQLAAQAGELLAQIRPLLASSGAGVLIAPGEVLDAVRRGLADAPGAERLEVRPAPRGLPDVRVDPDALLHALLTLVRGALEASLDTGSVVLQARRSGRHVWFEIVDSGRRFEPAPPRALPRGRALAVRLADAALRPDGGAAEVRPGRGTTRVRVRVAIAPAARRRAPGTGRNKATRSTRG